MPHRPERLAEMIRDELTELVEGELADPRIGLASVTEVNLAPEMRVAHIFVAVVGNEQEQQRSLQGLVAAKGFLRAELGSRLQLRHVPELRFELDRSEERRTRLESLLMRSRQRDAAMKRRNGDALPAEKEDL
ncbi:MAG TPA: 30S ribosome-binding factor RbfA [Terriglobales bacterium]|nr:30S ribosome-binding factor RbfA [Terriglobales bacterium]